MVGVDGPPRVDEHVEHRQEQDEERRRPLCLEPDDDHDARAETKERDDHSGERPIALEDESDEEEDEENTSGELEAGGGKDGRKAMVST